MTTFTEGHYDIVVIGAGHAGCEAALACARLGLKTVMLTLNLDSIAFMACNPSIGGTGKGHIVREIDALGGEMGRNSDKTAIQMRLLNEGKGEAVQCLRAQCDKNAYHREMKRTLEHTENLRILQGEAADIQTEDGHVSAVVTTYGGILYCRAAIVATGVYLNARTITGEFTRSSGPSGFAPATALTDCLIRLGYSVRRFKTGTPARLDGRTVHFEECTPQAGEDVPPFSYTTQKPIQNIRKCYLTYTNNDTHTIILDNLDRSPLYNGEILSTGPRYCPSIETKVVRFRDKDRHQIFLEPEGLDTDEVYVQGMSSSMPHDIQREMYRSVPGLEDCEIMRYAYAIEYDCIDPLDILPTLEFKKVKGLYTAGQINGTSGYEEAAAQGLVAGINAAFALQGREPLILSRDESYIGVLIDDLVTKGTEEPYRIMTSRAEWSLLLRHDTADFRLTPKIMDTTLYTPEKKKAYESRMAYYNDTISFLDSKCDRKILKEFCDAKGIQFTSNISTYADIIRHGGKASDICDIFGILGDVPRDIIKSAEITIKYAGYMDKSAKQVERFRKLESKKLPADLNYSTISGLRLEAREKLERIRPLTLGQAARISGVNPADITVLMVYLSIK
ncbi:MAG: tRNA uridine-5-carboxymethylaminomethyl(34) synthesis enzyme MnmG [Clostridia bacterium]|nr:tRNA uridine-5-carboxymethylaminomethyl(34) synthesis enzyme MnmG [Clostridia bacterium]